MARILWLQNLWIQFYGVMQISAVLKQHGHQCDVHLGDAQSIVDRVREWRPNVVAYSVMSDQWNWVKETSTAIARSGIPTTIVVGGAHGTMYPEATIEHPAINVVCTHEGEYALLELCDAIDSGRDFASTPGLWVRRGGSVHRNGARRKLSSGELAALPFADRDLYRKYQHFRTYPFETFVGSRGCPYRCSFCAVPTLNAAIGHAKPTSYCPPERLVEETKSARDRGLLENKLVMFSDSTFNSHTKWLLEFLELYGREVRVPFSCNLRVDRVTEEQVRALKEAGVDNVRFGIESGDEQIRTTLLGKRISDEELIECSELLHKYRIPFTTFNLFGVPGETLEQAWKTVKINQALKPTATAAYICEFFPGNRITDYAIEKGFLAAEDLEMWSDPPYNIHLTLLSRHLDRSPDAIRISNLQKFAVLVVKRPRLEAAVRKLCEWPPLRVFNVIYALLQCWEVRQWSTRTTFGGLLYEGLLSYEGLLNTTESKLDPVRYLSRLLVRWNERREAPRPTPNPALNTPPKPTPP